MQRMGYGPLNIPVNCPVSSSVYGPVNGPVNIPVNGSGHCSSWEQWHQTSVF